MEQKTHKLRNGLEIVIREAAAEDARLLIDYVQSICSETVFLTFGPGEFELTESEEKAFLQKCRKAKNHLFMMGVINGTIVSTLNFSGGNRPRVMHCGELGMSVQRKYWGLGIGGLMLDTLFSWAKNNGIIKKINLRVRTDNHRALSLYERKGFLKEGTIRKEIFLDGNFHDHYWMGLEID